jgi:thiamine biosynthesis lipoprotein ApbE
MRKSVALLSLLLAGCAAEKRIERVEWTVMGTVAAVQFRGEVDRAVVAEVRRVFREVEEKLNSHDPSSEIRRLSSESDGKAVQMCDPRMRPCYEAAFAFREETEGRFHPRWRGEGTLDFGAVAKGFAVDLAARAVADKTAGKDVLIDLGGNLKSVSGTWKTAIANCGETISLAPGEACATSAAYYRGGHIKDGTSGRTAQTDVFSVTVVHPSSAMTADMLSTAMYIMGEAKGRKFLSERYSTARAVFVRKDPR